MIYALDANVASEPRKPRPHSAVVAWFAARPTSDFAIPAIVFYELQQGVEMTRMQDKARASELEEWIDSLQRLTVILPFDELVARETARLMNRKSPHLFVDAAVAATAIVHGLTVATRNTKDFIGFRVPLVDPFVSRS